MHKVLIIVFLFLGKLAFCQSLLNDTIDASPTGTYVQTLHETDSGYYFVGMIPHPSNPGNPDQFFLGFIDHEGNWETKLLEYDGEDQRSAFSINKLQVNNDGNFVTAYSSCSSYCYPRIKEVTPEGVVVRDTIYKDIIDSLGLAILDFNNVYFDSNLEEYTLLMNTYDTAKFANSEDDYGNLLYLKLDDDFQVLDTILFTDPDQLFAYLSASMCWKPDGTKVILIQDNFQSPWPENESGKMVFYEVDTQDNYMKVAEYEPSQNNRYVFSLIGSADSSYVFTYIGSTWDTLSNDWLYSNHICKLDWDYDMIWDVSLTLNPYPTPVSEIINYCIIESGDSCYITANGGETGAYGAQLYKLDANGNQLWRRRILKVIPSQLPETSYSSVIIRDIIENENNGFTLFGRLRNNVFGVGPFIYGYIIETNCLGFVAPPEAHAAHEVRDDFEIAFHNESMQAGSYTWYFGDGTSLETGEYADTVSHIYEGFGTYEVMLIAHGCDEERDTTIFQVNPTLHADPTVVTDGQGYYTIFPNPVQVGSELYVYLNGLILEDGEVLLQFYTEDGKIAEEIPLTAMEGTYIITPNLSSGLYLTRLVGMGEVLQTRKLIVH